MDYVTAFVYGAFFASALWAIAITYVSFNIRLEQHRRREEERRRNDRRM